LCGGGVQFPVEGDDAAEGGFGIGLVGQFIGGGDAVEAHRHAAGVGVLDDHAGGLGEGFDAFQGGIGVRHVVVGQRLALQLAGGGDAGVPRLRVHVEGGLLVGVLAVAHVLLFVGLQVEGVGEVPLLVLRIPGAEVVGDHAVVGGGVPEGLDHQGVAGAVGELAVVGLQFVDDRAVVAGVHHDGHGPVVLGGGAHHGGAADVDVLDGGGQVAVGVRHRGGEGVEVDHHHVDGLDAVLRHHPVVDAPAAEDAAVDLRVQGLDPAVHHLR